MEPRLKFSGFYLRPSVLYGHREVRTSVSSAAVADGIVTHDAQLVQDGHGGEQDVEQEADRAQFPVQPPAVEVSCQEEDEDGQEERGCGEDQTGAVHHHRCRRGYERRADEPRHAQAQHVKHIGTHDVGHSHVSFT